VITGVAFCPQAPALVPDIGRGLDAELGPLREACRAAVRQVARDGARVEVLGARAAVAIGDWLVRDAGVRRALDGADTALLVLGDGSARRTEKAPGYLDERAEPFDRGVADALRSGDPARLAALDADLGTQLLAAGVPAWHEAAARLAGERFTAELHYDDVPFGVGYFVAVWTRA
jgi:hypothetical protein